MRRAHPAAVAGLVLSLSCRVRAAESPRIFRDTTFDAALKSAAAEKKIVMADFYTEWCVPCKRMDLMTWRDPAVATFLDGKAVSLKIDAGKEEKLASRYRVKSFPTMILVRPDGTEIDSLSGFKTPDEFLSEFKDALAGKTALRRARAAVAAAEAKGDATLRANAGKVLAGVLAQKGDFAAALKEYLWLYDDGMKKLPAFAGVRSSYILTAIQELDYPPAMAALRERRDAARKRLEGNSFSEDDGLDYASLNRVLGDSTATLKFFDTLPAGDPRRKIVGPSVFDALLKARRYADAVEVQPAEKARADFELGVQWAWGPHPAADAEMLRVDREFYMSTAAEGLEALAGAGRFDDARGLILRMLAVEDAPWVRALLREHLKRAGRPELFEPVKTP